MLNKKINTKYETQIEKTLWGTMWGVFLITLAAVILMVTLTMNTGCSTVSGVGKLMQGIGNDIEDSAEGTRQRMKER